VVRKWHLSGTQRRLMSSSNHLVQYADLLSGHCAHPRAANSLLVGAAGLEPTTCWL
jgi:hypothetical protein